jgi:hypothetical protein
VDLSNCSTGDEQQATVEEFLLGDMRLYEVPPLFNFLRLADGVDQVDNAAFEASFIGRGHFLAV